MKSITLILLISTFAFSGFYTEDSTGDQAAYIENERLCKIFTSKAKKYKESMRDDVLAVASLASYKHRASIFCKQAEEAKKSF